MTDDDRDFDRPARTPSRWPAAVGVVLVVGGIGGLGYWYYEKVETQRRAAAAVREEARRDEEREWAEAEVARAARRVTVADAGALAGNLLAPAAPPRTPAETRQLADRLSKQLVGTWRGTTTDGAAREVEYRADGTFRDAVTGGSAARTLAGTWTAATPTGTRVLKVERTGGGPAAVRVTFEGDELVHDGDRPGVADVLRKP